MKKFGSSALDRRAFLTGVATAGLAAVTTSAFAQQTDIGEILAAPRRGNWDDQFDARSTTRAKVAGFQPIASPETVSFTESAINTYNQIVSSGGWPTVQPTVKLQLGVVDPSVPAMRKRLMISGDLAETAGLSNSFDTYVDAAVKRFQSRHGLPADGVMGQYSLAAMNVPADIRLGQLHTNLERLRKLASDDQGPRYVMVNIPAAQIEAVEGWPCRPAPHSHRRQDRSPDANSRFQDSGSHPQSLLDGAKVDYPEGYHSADAQGSDLSDAQQDPAVRRADTRGNCAGDRRLEY